MNHISASNKYNARISHLWTRLFQSAVVGQTQTKIKMLAPCFCVPEADPDICVVGMNPSHSKRYLKEAKRSALESITELNAETITSLIELQIEAHKDHPYFKAIKNFLAEIDDTLKACFCDLYPIRHTSQSELMRFIDDPKSTVLMNELDQAIFDLFFETNASMIVICNAEASRRFRKLMNSNLSPTKCRAEDRLRTSHAKIPVFYSSMLSGQRAMDEFSRERLGSSIRQFWGNKHG